MNPSYNDPSLHISQEDLRYIARAQRTIATGGAGGSPASSRRSSTSVQSSSGGAAALSLDPKALAQLSAHFDGLLTAITSRVEVLSQQTLRSTNAHHRRAQSVADRASMEMERLREIIRQCDELQNEFLKIKRIGEIVKGFRTRVEILEQRIGK